MVFLIRLDWSYIREVQESGRTVLRVLSTTTTTTTTESHTDTEGVIGDAPSADLNRNVISSRRRGRSRGEREGGGLFEEIMLLSFRAHGLFVARVEGERAGVYVMITMMGMMMALVMKMAKKMQRIK